MKYYVKANAMIENSLSKHLALSVETGKIYGMSGYIKILVQKYCCCI